jgi:hypothetical protein
LTTIIRHIQSSLEHGRPMNIKTAPLAASVLKEIQKQTRTFEKQNPSR